LTLPEIETALPGAFPAARVVRRGSEIRVVPGGGDGTNFPVPAVWIEARRGNWEIGATNSVARVDLPGNADADAVVAAVRLLLPFAS
jgi:hypothetical protein